MQSGITISIQEQKEGVLKRLLKEMKLTTVVGYIAAISLVAFCFGASFLIPTDDFPLSSSQERPSLSIE